jgi:N-acyl-D-aspartate/D-glutamate deacylase
MPLEEAIRKITAFPAERFGLSGRGRLQPGYHADITVFNPDTVDSPATYEDPEAAPYGIELVIRNGRQEWPVGTMA